MKFYNLILVSFLCTFVRGFRGYGRGRLLLEKRKKQREQKKQEEKKKTKPILTQEKPKIN